MHETGRAPRAKEVGESESDQQAANARLELNGTIEILKHLHQTVVKSRSSRLFSFFINTKFSSSFSFLIFQPKSVPGVQVRASKTQNSPENAARERSRVRNLRQAFQSLQAALPSVPPDTKLSKLDVLVLATNYIAHLTETLDQGAAGSDHAALQRAEGYLHPVKVCFTQHSYLLFYRHAADS